jgi:hypothetical protein
MAQRVSIPNHEQWRRAGKWGLHAAASLWALLRVSVFAFVGLAFVFVTALLISIIQFQIRIIDAKTQSKNFSLTALTQSVEMQKEVVKSVKDIQLRESDISEFERFQESYGSKLIGVADALCRLHTDEDLHTKCVTGLGGALNQAAPATIYIIQMYLGQPFDQLADQFKTTAADAIKLTTERVDFQKEHGNSFARVQLACSKIGAYGSNFATDFAKGYLAGAMELCFRAGTGTAPTGRAESTPATPKTDLESDLSGALFFDLVAYYRFYEILFTDIHRDICNIVGKLFCRSGAPGGYADSAVPAQRDFGSGVVEQIVIAPIEITFVMLVIICGALGAMLRITAEVYKPELFGKQVEERKKTSRVYYFIIGIMCSLIVYILAKTVFSGLGDTASAGKSGNMSPFVTAFLAVVSGLLCEEAFQRIISAGRAALAHSTGGQQKGK